MTPVDIAIFEYHKCRYCLYREFLCRLNVLIYINFYNFYFSF